MAGTAVAVGVLGASLALTAALCSAGAAAVASQRAAGAADGAALAAADTASGSVTGVPCDRAGEVAASFGARVTSCTLDGLVATVAVTVPVGVLGASAVARAGPPP